MKHRDRPNLEDPALKPDSDSFLKQLRLEGLRLGFGGLGVCSGRDAIRMGFYRRWIEAGLHGEMAYLARTDAVARRGSLRLTMDSVRSVVVAAKDYFRADPPGMPEDPARGVIARYARGEDYHNVEKRRLEDLSAWIRKAALERGWAEEIRSRAYVDTGPILERELGRRAGLGWFGKNTMLIHPRRGSYFFIGILLLDIELPCEPSVQVDRCGSCQACMDACPTGALLGRDPTGAPVMDARRCISYLTIELKGPIPRELRARLGNRIFGCDICQEVCPWNRKFAPATTEPAYSAGPDTDGPSLLGLMALSEEEFALRFSGSPIKRAKRKGFLRNVAVALGNWGAEEAVSALVSALHDAEPLVRGHAAWALGEILSRAEVPGESDDVGRKALETRRGVEEDPWVLEELHLALRRAS